ncbi:Holliday junction resolvase RuvX [Paraferrimonas sedimenticola]|uniref:Putative pre-16S rRNA nuclease n=1 Tax=Paraferrimonas sedimenticola TaxID=375674 RepID=A0AA37W1R7_9GAMM|nr:Holliday junction resolvase RuvX [Paraferrimonas sedimenticola]GLP97123.1 putative pre-16S rRNA nuclease [Paraferrimonas sedimenticola]
MSHCLGFDYGTKSIGIAVGQAITGSASPLAALKARDGIPNWDSIEAIIKEWQPQTLVVGLPLNMDGTEQPFTARAKKFGNRLHGRFGLPVEFQDERLTTADAKERLFELGGFKKLQKGQIDSVSAVLILESFFEAGY